MKSRRATLTLAKLSALGIIPVVRVHSQETARKAILALADTGFGTAEITLTVPGALDLITEFSRKDDLLVGAGTVLDLKEAEASIRAGARYLVTPCLVDGVPELCQEAEVLCITGALTPSEILTAWRRQSGAVKVFPADSMGGPAYLRALKAVFPTIPLIPTGGIKLDLIGEYLRSGAVCVGAGSDLVNTVLLHMEDAAAVAAIGEKYLQAVHEARRGG